MANIATPITQRQIEILSLARDGLTVKEIAARLGNSPFTVRNILNDTLARLGAANTTQAVIIALRCKHIRLTKIF